MSTQIVSWAKNDRDAQYHLTTSGHEALCSIAIYELDVVEALPANAQICPLCQLIAGQIHEARCMQDFSMLVSGVARANRRLVQAEQDVAAFYAPSECYGDVARGHDQDVSQIFAQYGVTRQAYNIVLQERTTPKFAYFSGLLVYER